MAGLQLLLLLALTILQVRGECENLPKCECQLGSSDEREYQCGANQDNDDTGIISKIKNKVALIVQCSFNTTSSDLDMLIGMKVGPVQTIQFKYCPLPLMPLSDLLEKITGTTLNSTKTFIFQSHRSIGKELNRKHFQKLFNLTKLELSSNELTQVPEDLLEDMPLLTRLDMRENTLQLLPVGLLWSTSRLQELELGKNLLTKIPDDFFINLTSLRLLNLWRNKLSLFNSTTFSSLPALETLDLHSNGLKTLPQDLFYNLTKLSDLNLSFNNLTSLPEGIFNESKNLLRLRLLDNQVSNLELPNGFLSDLPKLKEISISRSGLAKLPQDFIKGSSSLTSLIITGNNMATIPEGLFRDAANLTMLDLSLNRIQSLPTGAFIGLTKLKHLKLAKNKLSILPNDILQSLEKLEELDLSNNAIKTVESGAFQGVPKLRVVRFNNNKLKFGGAPNDFFGSYSPLHLCIQLEELWLANNSLNEVFADWRLSMLKLRTLDLSYNNFTHVSMEDLHFLSGHLTVDLRHNHIKVMDMSNAEIVALAQEPQPQAREVEHSENSRSVRALLAHNPLDCTSCSTFYLLRYQENRMNPAVKRLLNVNTTGLQCSDDGPLSGKLITQLSSINFTCEIQENMCPSECECKMRLSDRSLHLKCCKTIKSLPELSFRLNNTEYSIQNCSLESAPNIFQINGYDKITAFYLSNNNISMFRVKHLPENVRTLELHNNNLSILSEALVRHLRENATHLKRLTLSGNPWNCDCESHYMLSYIHDYFQIVSDLVNVTCVDGRQFSQLTNSDLCYGKAKLAVAASMAIAIAGILLGMAAALYYRYQQEIKVWLYARNLCLWFVTEDELDKDKKYDAFVSYSHKDEEFVAQQLVPGLEPPFKLCIHVRDWVAGDWIPEQIARSVANSRRTLVILSPSFIDSVWGRMEFRAAHQQALSEGRVRVIVILLDDVGPIDKLDPELRAYLTMNTYLKWGDPWFWDKLRYALPHNSDIGSKDMRGWSWGRSRVRDSPVVLANRIDDKLELMRTGVDLGSRNVITSPPSPNSHTPPSAIAQDQNGICVINGNTRVV